MSGSQVNFWDKMKRSASILVLLVFAGCHSETNLPIDDVPKLPSKVDGASDRTIIQLQKKINGQGAQIITAGQNYLVSIPSAILFADQSPMMNWAAYALLNDIACYLQQFRKIGVSVNAYSSKYKSERREHALTLARARAVSEYLWSQGIDSRFIFTQGVGSDKPIVAFAKRGDVSTNSRIEITFRRAVA